MKDFKFQMKEYADSDRFVINGTHRQGSGDLWYIYLALNFTEKF